MANRYCRQSDATDDAELRISSALQVSVAELQSYAKAHRTPCVLFMPSSNATDATRYQQFVQNLHSKSTVSIISWRILMTDGDRDY